MSDRRLVIVRDVDRLDAAGVDLLTAYARDPAPCTCLVLVAEKIAKNSRLYKAVAATGVVYEYRAPKRGEYPSEVVRLFRERGKRAGLDAARLLVELVGRDLRRLDSEVSKIAAYAGESAEVSADDVRASAAASAEASVFELADAVGARDTAGAVRMVRGLLREGEAALGVHAMLARHVRALIGACALAGRGVAPEAMAPNLGMAPWQATNAARQARRFTPDELAGALRGLAAAEEEMKTSPTDAGLVLERWIVRTTAARDRDRAKA